MMKISILIFLIIGQCGGQIKAITGENTAILLRQKFAKTGQF